MNSLITIGRLQEAIADVLYSENAYHLPMVCSALGLEDGTIVEAMQSKRYYVKNRLLGKPQAFLIDLVFKLENRYPLNGTDLEEIINALKSSNEGVKGEAKNIIFAADGPKPELLLTDAINNRIKIVKNSEYCLIYDSPITQNGLLWDDLVVWWSKKMSLPYPDHGTSLNLYRRLKKSLASPPEDLLFTTYYRCFSNKLKESLPALIPQVYLHYDPKTFKELDGEQRLPRQRMDFLLLLSNKNRIVLEVDGQQHYVEGNTPSPMKYAEMVAADRDLRLKGYEIYRFGGYELDKNNGPIVIENFFNLLFTKHGVTN